MKNVMFESPYQDQVVAVEIGRVFTSGKAELVTDEQAARLLEKDANGKPLHPYFSLAPTSVVGAQNAQAAAEAAAASGDKVAEEVK